jgi:sugar lactone lactonase YvrE
MRSRRGLLRGGVGALALLLAGAMARAHPGVGIVKDGRGNVFYTDLKQVWKIVPDGTKSVAVPDVHTHELCLDADDNLYGEHLWYEGDATGKWGHRVWRLEPDGTLSDVIPAREGFLNDASFVRDRAGHMYWADRGARTVLKKRSPDGTIRDHADAGFRDVRWMTAVPDGTLFLIDAGDLLRVAPDGRVTTVAARLSSRDPAPAGVADRHYHMGLCADDTGSVYVAVAEERLVLRMASDGERTVVARSPRGWAPSGVLRDGDGNLWLLEYSTGLLQASETRVRRVGRDGQERIF